jgi:hypothetical protein
MHRVGLFTVAALYATSLAVYSAQEVGITTTGQADLPPAVVPAASGSTASLLVSAAGFSNAPAFMDTISGESRVAPQTRIALAADLFRNRGTS